MSTLTSYNSLVSTISSIAKSAVSNSSITLTSEQEATLSAINTTVQNFPTVQKSTNESKRVLITCVTKRELETGNHVFKGTNTFTGPTNYTGSVNLSDTIVTSDDLNQFNGATHSAHLGGSSPYIRVSLDTSSGLGQASYQVNDTQINDNPISGNYNVIFSDDDKFTEGTCRKFCIINMPTSSGSGSLPPAAVGYGYDNLDDLNTFVYVKTNGTATAGYPLVQEFTVTKVDGQTMIFVVNNYFSQIV